MIYLSANAISRMDQMNKAFIKVKIFFGGCNGFKYTFSFPESIEGTEGEYAYFDHANKTIVADQFTLSRIDGATIDFAESLMEEKFYIASPNFKRTCHCGTSFKA